MSDPVASDKPDEASQVEQTPVTPGPTTESDDYITREHSAYETNTATVATAGETNTTAMAATADKINTTAMVATADEINTTATVATADEINTTATVATATSATAIATESEAADGLKAEFTGKEGGASSPEVGGPSSPVLTNERRESAHSSKSGKRRKSTEEKRGSESPAPSGKIEKPRGSVSKASSKADSSGGAVEGKKKGKKNKKKKKVEVVDTGLPENVQPIFLSVKTQEIFNVRADVDVKTDMLQKNINKSEIVEDFHNRAAVSDFHPFKQQILDYPGEEILLVYDPEFTHGQNFYIALTEAARTNLIELLTSEDAEEDDDDADEMEEIETMHYTGPSAKSWISLGSELDIVPDIGQEHNLITSAVRARRLFGAECKFSDRDSGAVRDGYVECPPYVDQNFEINKIELDKSVQAVARLRDTYVQTDWKYPKNAAVQYVARELTWEQKQEIEQSEDYKQFILTTAARVELALQQNNIMDVFADDWVALAAEESELGNKADNHLKEFQSFTDLQVSKDRMVTAVDWHPTIKGVIAVALAERMTFDERVNARFKISMKPSVILVWSFSDPIHPQLLLEAPDDIIAFKFCPTDPNIVAGGCVNGQIVLWDISEYSARLRLARSGKFKETQKTLAGFEDEGSHAQPVIRYAAVSAIEHSHRAAVHDIQWIPEHFEASRSGIPIDNKTGQCCQLVSCSTDQTILWWDIRPPPNLPKPETSKKSSNPFGVPTTFKHLDLTWKPLFKINLLRSEPGGDHAPTKFSLAEQHRSRGSRVVRRLAGGGGDVDNNQSATSNVTTATPANLISTHMYAGTEDGELVYVDWVPKKDQDSGRIMTGKPLYYHTLHDGPIVTLQRSPFFHDVVLCVGGWSFSIWKEGVASGPILRSPMNTRKMTGGHWSTTRPSVFYISLQDGGLEIWDLLDKTHEACITQSISSAPITCLAPHQLSSKQHLLAVCDDRGTLHVLTIPWSLRQPTPGEKQGMSNYVEREVKRREFVRERLEYREREKILLDLEAKKKAGVAVVAEVTEDELEARMKAEYAQYLVDEQAFLRQLDIVVDA